MKIHEGDIIRLEGEIGGHMVIALEGFGDSDHLLLDDGREIRKSDVIELSDDDDGDDELSDEGPMPDLSDEGFWDGRAD